MTERQTVSVYCLVLETDERAGGDKHVYGPYATHQAAEDAMDRAWGTESVCDIEIIELKTPTDLEATCKIYEDERDESE